MWAVDNRTPYPAGRTWGRNKDGVHEWIVAVKGTFDIRGDGSVTRADEQFEPLLVPEYHGDDGASSLKYDADLVGPKPATDVVVNGTAYAPQGRPAREFVASLDVGDIHKSIRVVGNRMWERNIVKNTPSVAEPVVKVPIVYERAYGGFDQSDPDPGRQRMDTRNPVGCGMVQQVGSPLPNFEYPGSSIDKAGPAGFGALASYWSPRREFSGTYDEEWKKHRFPLLPEDWDPRSLLCSPADQRLPVFLKGGEPVELRNLTPEGVLRFTIPKVRFTFGTVFSTRSRTRPVEHEARLTTVIIEPDLRRLILVWSSTLPCPRDGDYLEETIVREAPSL